MLFAPADMGMVVASVVWCPQRKAHMSRPEVRFASPRKLPKASTLAGRVVVLDIAFAADAGGGVSYEAVTQPFIDDLGDRLAAWVYHYDHP